MVEMLAKDYQRILPITLFYKFWIEDDDKISNITESLKSFYFGNRSISSETPFELVRVSIRVVEILSMYYYARNKWLRQIYVFLQLFTDAYFAYGAIEAVKRHKTKVYFYYYDHRNERTLNEIFGKYPIDLGE